MKKVRFSKRVIETLEAPTSGRRVVWDEVTPGFAVVVYPSGRRSFCLTYRGQDGKERQLKLGSFGAVTVETAREAALSHWARIAVGGDPKRELAESREAARRGMTLAEFWPFYWRDAKARLKARTLADYDELWNRRIEPALGARRLDRLTRRDVALFHAGMGDVPTRANRALATLRAALSFAVSMEFIDSNPAKGVRAFRERRGARFLSLEELGRLFRALDKMEFLGERSAEVKRRRVGLSRATAGLFRLLIFTGARVGEIRAARWDYWDCEAQTLSLPDSKTGAKMIYLNSLAVAELEALWNYDWRDVSSPWIIEGDVKSEPLVQYQKSWDRVCLEAKLSGVRVHDLRHSFASLAVGSGLGLFVLGRALGHSNPATTNRYAHLADDPLRAAVEVVAEAMRGVIEVAPKIVELAPEELKGEG